MKKISLFVVTAAAVALVLSGCSRGPVMADEQPMMPSLDGTWHFAAASVEIEAGAFTVIAGDTTMALGTEVPFATITKAVVKGTIATIAGQDGAYTLTVGTDAPSVQLTFLPTVTEAEKVTLRATVMEALMAAGNAPVMIGIDAEADPVTMTVTGPFITTLLGEPMGTKLIACMGAPCMVMAP